MCHQIRGRGIEGERERGGAGELQEGFKHLASQPRVRPDSLVEQCDGLGRDRCGDGTPGVGRAEMRRNRGKGLSRGSGAAGRRGRGVGGGVSRGGEGQKGHDVHRHDEA